MSTWGLALTNDQWNRIQSGETVRVHVDDTRTRDGGVVLAEHFVLDRDNAKILYLTKRNTQYCPYLESPMATG